MSNNRKTFLASLAIVALLFAAVLGMSRQAASPALGVTVDNQAYSYLSTSTSIAVSAVTGASGLPTLLLATSTTRQYADICNDNAATKLYLYISGGNAATTSAASGIIVAPSACYEMFYPAKMFSGAVYGMASTSDSVTVSALQ